MTTALVHLPVGPLGSTGGGGGGGTGAQFDAEVIAAGVTGAGNVAAGSVDALRGKKNSTDPAVIAKRDAGRRKIGEGMVQAGGAIAMAGLSAPPWGLIASAVGLAIMANGAIVSAYHSRDPVKVALTNAFRKQGHSRAYSKQAAKLVGKPLTEVQGTLEKYKGKKGWGDRQREEAARDLLTTYVVDAAQQNTAIVVEKKRYAASIVEAQSRTQRVIMVTWIALLLVGAALFVVSRVRRR